MPCKITLRLSLALAPLLVVNSALAGNYEYKTLTMSGAENVYPYAINDSNIVVGSYTERHFLQDHGFVWSKGKYTLVDGPGGNTSLVSINRHGLAAGESMSGAGLTYVAFTFDTATGHLQAIPEAPHGAGLDYYPTAINASGRVVGATASGGGGSTPGVGWVGDLKASKLLQVPGTAPQAFSGEPALGINDQGDVVGNYPLTTGGGQVLGYVFQAGSYTSFNPADQAAVEVGVLPTFINDAGVIGGGVTSQNEPSYGFTLDHGQTTQYPIAGARIVNVVGITKSGEVVGTWQDTSLNWHGFTVSNGITQSFDAPGATSTMITGVNAEGTLVGSETRTINGHGHSRGFIAHCPRANAPCTQ